MEYSDTARREKEGHKDRIALPLVVRDSARAIGLWQISSFKLENREKMSVW